jgi:hypothetical protein
VSSSAKSKSTLTTFLKFLSTSKNKLWVYIFFHRL